MDLFGKNKNDYKFYRDLGENFEDYQRSLEEETGKSHDLNSLIRREAPKDQFQRDSESLAFLTNNMTAVSAQVTETIYSDARYARLVPVITSGVQPGARAVGFDVIKEHGEASYIANDGSDANKVSTTMERKVYPLRYAGAVWGYSLEDLRNAAFAGVALETRNIRAATRASLDFIDKVAIMGEDGNKGLINQNASDVFTVNSGVTMEAGTGDSLISEIKSWVAKLVIDTNEVAAKFSNLTLYMPLAELDILSGKFRGSGGMSVYDVVRSNNLYTNLSGTPLTIVGVKELADNSRAILAPRDPDVMSLYVPIAPRPGNVVQTPFGVQGSIEFKVSDMFIKRKSVLYVNNI